MSSSVTGTGGAPVDPTGAGELDATKGASVSGKPVVAAGADAKLSPAEAGTGVGTTAIADREAEAKAQPVTKEPPTVAADDQAEPPAAPTEPPAAKPTPTAPTEEPVTPKQTEETEGDDQATAPTPEKPKSDPESATAPAPAPAPTPKTQGTKPPVTPGPQGPETSGQTEKPDEQTGLTVTEASASGAGTKPPVTPGPQGPETSGQTVPKVTPEGDQKIFGNIITQLNGSKVGNAGIFRRFFAWMRSLAHHSSTDIELAKKFSRSGDFSKIKNRAEFLKGAFIFIKGASNLPLKKEAAKNLLIFCKGFLSSHKTDEENIALGTAIKTGISELKLNDDGSMNGLLGDLPGKEDPK